MGCARRLALLGLTSWGLTTWALAGSALGLVGCQSASFLCSTDAVCDGGMCQPDGYCSFEDGTCETGQRYGELAPADLAGQCVPVMPATTGTGSTTDSAGTATASASGSSDTTQTGLDTDGVSATSGGTDGSAGTTAVTTGDTTDPSGSTGAAGETGVIDPCPIFVDDFDDGVIGAPWETHNEDLLSEVDGQLQVSIDALSPGYGRVRIPEGFNLKDGWFRAQLGQPASTPGVQQSLEVRNLDDTSMGAALVLSGGGALRARHYQGAGDYVDIADIPFDPQQHAWLQIRGAGLTVYFETSANGVDFETFAEFQPTFDLKQMRPELEGGAWMTLLENVVVSFERAELCEN